MPGPAGDDQKVAFKRRDARRIQTVVNSWERGYLNEPPGRIGGAYGGGPRHAKATTAISARSGVTAGSGSAQLYHLVGATLTLDSPAVTIAVSNVFAVAVASGAWLVVQPIDGVWSVVAVDCP